jgi:hypothetical protein
MKLVLNKKLEYITYKTLIFTNYTRIIRRLASIIRTITSKTYSITTRSNIYISYKDNIDINQKNKKKVKKLYSTNLYIKLEARSQKRKEKKVKSKYKQVIKLGNSLRERK